MDRLNLDEHLDVGGELVSSPRGWLLLVLQGDGNLALNRTQTRQPLWASNTVGQPVTRVIMQGGGNLEAYTAADVPGLGERDGRERLATGFGGHRRVPPSRLPDRGDLLAPAV